MPYKEVDKDEFFANQKKYFQEMNEGWRIGLREPDGSVVLTLGHLSAPACHCGCEFCCKKESDNI